MRYDAIIIGAGHNGLTAAAYLAKASKRVLVLERRDVIGGCAVTEEVDSIRAPGCRVSTASYIASMLSSQVINDLKLGDHGLCMVACEPGVQAAFEDGSVMSHWGDEQRMRAELERYAPDDIERFFDVDARLKKLATYLQPYFLESPPDLDQRGFARLWQGVKTARRFRGLSGNQMTELVAFLTGSLGDFLDRNFASQKLKRLILANSLYGKHGGPYQPGTAVGLLFHLLNGGEHQQQGFQGHVMGGMGAISQALADVCVQNGVHIRPSSPVELINVQNNRAHGVTLAGGEVIDAKLVVSNADPKRTYLSLVDGSHLEADFRRQVDGIRMNGPCGKVNFVLSEEPSVTGMPTTHSKSERALFTLVPTLQQAESSYFEASTGRIPEHLWVDCVLASNVDDSLTTASKHVLTCFVQYLPYKIVDNDWGAAASTLGDQVTNIIGRYVPNFDQSVIARDVVTPLELERRFGLTEGNIFHGDISLEQLFVSRPLAGWARYRSPIEGLYLCGAGTHPGGGVTAAPGYNAARQILANGD